MTTKRTDMQKKMTAAELMNIVTQEHMDYSWSRTDFPKDLCTIEMQGDGSVIDSDTYFLCLLVDVKSTFVTTAEIRTLRPYVYYDVETQEALYGWIDSCGNVYDHRDHDIHNDRERVVAWRAL